MAAGCLQNQQLSPNVYIYPVNQIKKPQAFQGPRGCGRLVRGISAQNPLSQDSSLDSYI